ncbi:RNaseH domain-containing protein [Ottowia oryzae]
MRFTGPLQTALQSLLEASKGKDDKNLPIGKLRALFMAKLEGIVRLDRDLALKDAAKAALELRAVGDDLFDEARHAELKEEIAGTLLRWHMDVVAPWAERNALVEPASAVKREISAAHIDMQPRRQALVVRQGNGQVAKPQWDLIAKHLAERLAGEELFEGLGPCELIADATSLEGSVELMTWPTKVTGSDTTFSMVARLSVASLPTGGELYLKITPVKRVWAKKVPGRKPNAPPTVRCYVFSPEYPVLPANIRRNKEGWEFGDEYGLYQSLTTERDALPVTLDDAIRRPRPTSGSWWVGLPELTTLFDYVQQRTVFESDEVDLRDRVVELLPDVLDPVVPYRVVKIPRAMTQAKSEVARLKVGDVAPDEDDVGVAGAALKQPEPSEDEESSSTTDEEAAVDDGATEAKRRSRLERHRNANSSALKRIHPNHTPSLWVFVDGADEKKLIEGSAKAVFGDSLRLEFSPLPQGVHGLRSDLELSDEKGVRRFEARVDRWKPIAEQVKAGATGARHVLICAAKDVGNRAEDPVNYFAGLHAMCMYGEANVHHLLPLEKDRRTGQLDVQHFIHRVQSALLDVFLAHSGVVFGVQSFVQGCLGNNAPKAIYGVQAVRSNARAFTQEQRVCLIVFTRLEVATGATSVAFTGRKGSRVTQMDWKPLNEGLQWLGSQRQLSGDERWLKESFGDIARKTLGKICEEDPKAVVLVDWSTVAGLWKELSDESLIAAQGRRAVLDGTDFGTAYPQMTLLRLRSDRNATMVMRWVNTKKFDEWRSEPAPTPTRTSIEEQYATTYKTAVALDEAAAGGGLKHYLVVMGYRNTVQTKRGMSSFRPRSRMSTKGNGWFERRTLPVAKDNAALPGGLEVTVVHASDALKPDSLVSLVMGLRLGYAHYDDWTALPAPLFFERKVRDYVIRYADSAEAEGVEATVPNSDSQAPESTPAVMEMASSLQSELVAEVLEGLPELTVDTAMTMDAASPGGTVPRADGAATTKQSASQAEPEPSATQAMHEEEKPATLDDPRLQRALEAGQSTLVLFSPASGLAAKQTYEAMLAESVLVRVEPPWFVTKDTVLPPDAWPKDKRAIGYYWKKLGTFPIRLRPQKGDAPSVAQFPDWVMRRLSIPQSAYALDISQLLPVSKRLFYKLDDCYGQYLEESGKKEGGVSGGQFWKDLPDLVRHLSKEKNDEGLGWAFCMMGHHPYKDLLPDVLKAVDSSAMGPYALAGLEYMTTCFEVCKQVYDDRRNGTWKNKTYFVPGILRPADLVEPAQALPAPSASNVSTAETLASAAASTALAAAAELVVGGTESAAATAPPVAAQAITRGEDLSRAPPEWPVPGSGDFDTLLAACRAHLEDLKTRHEHHEHHEAARRAAEAAEEACRVAEAQERAAAEAAVAAVRLQWQHTLAGLETLAREALAAMGPELEAGNWHVLAAEHVVGSEPNDEACQAVEQQVVELQQAVAQANFAAQAVAKIDAGEFEGGETLTARDKLRRKTALLGEALERAGEAEQNLKTVLTACALLAEGPGTSPPDPTPDQRPETEPDPICDPHTVVPEPAPAVVEQTAAVAEAPEIVVVETKEAFEQAAAEPAGVAIAQPAAVAAVDEVESEPPHPDFEDSLPPEDFEVIQSQASGPQPLTEPALQTLAECLNGRYWALASAEAIARGDDAKVRAMLPDVQKLAGKGLATIDDLRRKIGRRRPIEGVGRDYLVQNLRVTAAFTAEYVALLDKQKSSKQASLPPKHADFLSGLFRELKMALGYVADLDLAEDASAVHKQLLVSALTAAIDLMGQDAREGTVAEEEQVLLLRYPLGRDLKPVLTWSPSGDAANQVTLGEAGQLHSAVTQALASLRRGLPGEGRATGLQRLLVDAAEEHRVAQRLLPARIIAERLDRQGRPMASTWHEATDAVYRDARNAFKLEVQEAQQRVTNALALSALSQTEAGRMLKVLESLSRANNAQEIGASPKGATLYPDFPHARAVLQPFFCAVEGCPCSNAHSWDISTKCSSWTTTWWLTSPRTRLNVLRSCWKSACCPSTLIRTTTTTRVRCRLKCSSGALRNLRTCAMWRPRRCSMAAVDWANPLF